MPNLSSDDSLIFYPAYCFPLSPTYNTWARLTAADVHALKKREGYDSQNIYFHLNHPIKWVRLVGVIVALDCYYNRWSMVLDDSCGATIELSCKRPILPKQPTNNATLDKPKSSPSVENSQDDEIVLSQDQDPAYAGLTDTGRTINLKGFDVGAVVKVKGGLMIYGGEQQVRIEIISILPTTNDEVTAWAETSAFRRDILGTSWVVGDQELRRARREAEGLERRHERRQLAEKKGRRKNQKNVGEEELMRERSIKKDKTSSHLPRRRATEDEGRINNATNEEHGQEGRTRTQQQQQREKMKEDERERAKEEEEEEGLMIRRRRREQDEGKNNQRKTSKFSQGRVHRGEVRIPKDQQDLLNREEFLLSDGSIVNGKGKGKEKKLKSSKKFGNNDNHSCHHLPFPPPTGKFDALGL